MSAERGTLLLDEVPATAEKTVAGAASTTGAGVVVTGAAASVAKGEAEGAGAALTGAAVSGPPKIPAMLDLPPGGAWRRVEDRSIGMKRERERQ